jgi:hypothetical protein
MVIRFYKEDYKWYADLPKYIEEEGGSKDDLEMVAGADTWLDILSEDGNEIHLKILTEPFPNFEAKLLYVGDHAINGEGTYVVYPDNHQLWLCGVAVWLFKEYPQAIYYKVISIEESLECLKFELNKNQQLKYELWKASLPNIINRGSYWFKFTHTGIGTGVLVGRSDVPEHDMDLTDYESF